GVDGFRMDVINLVSKDVGAVDGEQGGAGIVGGGRGGGVHGRESSPDGRHGGARRTARRRESTLPAAPV
ncbi:hypothetical protein, partial [Rathayibacter sp. AY1A3]|uniref:hypothetical protein n=1 Tax=Rathayibacter sp. AY1A3 TaxID=2080521 RepID=UPI001CA5C7A9